MDEAVLIRGDKQTVSEFYVRTAFPFADPFGLLFENRVKFVFCRVSGQYAALGFYLLRRLCFLPI